MKSKHEIEKKSQPLGQQIEVNMVWERSRPYPPVTSFQCTAQGKSFVLDYTVTKI